MSDWMKRLDSETLESSRTEVPTPWGERLGHSSRAQQACPCLAGGHSDASLKGTFPGLAGDTWLQHAPPAPRWLAPAPGPATPEEEGTADGWPSGHIGGCLGRRPLPSSHQSMWYILFLSAQNCQWWRGAGVAPGWTCLLPDFSSGPPGVCWVCLWPPDSAWTGLCRGQEECDQGDKDPAGGL